MTQDLSPSWVGLILLSSSTALEPGISGIVAQEISAFPVHLNPRFSTEVAATGFPLPLRGLGEFAAGLAAQDGQVVPVCEDRPDGPGDEDGQAR